MHGREWAQKFARVLDQDRRAAAADSEVIRRAESESETRAKRVEQAFTELASHARRSVAEAQDELKSVPIVHSQHSQDSFSINLGNVVGTSTLAADRTGFELLLRCTSTMPPGVSESPIIPDESTSVDAVAMSGEAIAWHYGNKPTSTDPMVDRLLDRIGTYYRKRNVR